MIQTETQKIKTIKTVGSICSIKNRFSIAKIISLSRKISTSFFYFSFTLVVLILVSSCNPAKRLLDGENLMASYQVKIDNHSLDKNELENIVKQKPNKAIIRFGNHRYLRFHLWFYNFADIGKPRKYKDWLKRVIGEEPVLLDTFLTKKSTSQLKLFLIKKGFFNSIASDTTIYKHKQAFVTYNLKFGLPYHFRDYDYSIKDTAILNVLLSETSKTLIKQGDNYDEFVLEQERERITKLLRNNGYYYFLKEYIYFDADTSLGSREANITLGIKNPEKKNSETDSIVEGKHEKYYLNNVYIVPDFVAKQKNKIFQDTVLYLNYYFLFDHKMRYRKRILVQPFFLKEGELYSQQNVEETYRLMSNLRAFKFTNVNFEEVKNDSNQHLLNAYLQLSPSPKQAFSTAAEGTYSSGNLGISGNLIYQNKNVFRGAEIFEIRLNSGLEVQQISKDIGEVKSSTPFNIFQIGPGFSLNFPRILFPLPAKILTRNLKPKTTIAFSYNYQKRPEFYGTIANFSYSYNWQPYKQKYLRLSFTPSEINFVKVFLDEDFRKKLEDSGNPISLKRYDPLFINSIQFNLVYNNQDETTLRNFSYFRFGVETGGNIPTWYNQLSGEKRNEQGVYEKFGINYAQYWKGDVDYRFYHKTSPLNKIAVRTYFGIGNAYNNSKILPFVKSFYGGGVNDIRAWKTRKLGPGSLPDSLAGSIDQVGDLKIELNVEYRYNVYKYLNAATFVDAGNIWLLKPNAKAPGANFKRETAIRDMAIGAGFGLRFDFSFFVFRLDGAYPIYDPGYDIGQRWVRVPKLKEVVLSFGIGYPF